MKQMVNIFISFIQYLPHLSNSVAILGIFHIKIYYKIKQPCEYKTAFYVLILQSALSCEPLLTYQIFIEQIISCLFPEFVRGPQNIVYSAQVHISCKMQAQIDCFWKVFRAMYLKYLSLLWDFFIFIFLPLKNHEVCYMETGFKQ